MKFTKNHIPRLHSVRLKITPGSQKMWGSYPLTGKPEVFLECQYAHYQDINTAGEGTDCNKALDSLVIQEEEYYRKSNKVDGRAGSVEMNEYNLIK